MNIFWGENFESEFTEEPIVLVDVGARGGVQDRWSAAQKHLSVIGFEPEPEEFRLLSQKNSKGQVFLNTALFNAPGEIDLHITRAPGRSSVFEPNQALLRRFFDDSMMEGFEVIRKVRLKADTLDRQLAANGLRGPDFMKLDTQGSELAILKGSEKTLRDSVVGLEIEVEFLPLYKDQPLFPELQAFLSRFDFELFDLMPRFAKRAGGKNLGKRKGQLLYGDALFFKSPSAILAMGARMESEARRRRFFLRAISIFALYGYFDFSMEILSQSGSAFTAGERAQVERELIQNTPGWTKVPYFPGRARLARVFYKLFRILYPSPTARKDSGITMGGYFLGNTDF